MTAPIPVLVVEDERPLAQIVADYLTKGGFVVTQVHNGPDAVDLARTQDPDLILLDLGLPGLDGVEVCRIIRTFSDCYIIMLTAREDEIDKLIGLGVGADDYITKPFSPREVVARAQAAVRRPRLSKLTTPQTGDLLRFNGLTLDLAAREVSLSDGPVHLTRTEFDLLVALAQAPRRVFSRRQLVDAVWGEGWGGDEHIVDVHIAHLRSKLGEAATEPLFIDTVRGVGYRFKTDQIKTVQSR
ncbi:response regulator [Nocardioides sp. NPDC057767]|uniref:DNA-binding response OmpR family regulator n=2 Tax=Nocardioides TaxID=1839 RepID=A0A543A8Q2_9ACTN|nr:MULTISPECIES: response regulator transcription factor [Nocardioides]NYI77068.1 DNA-binding response OmpR family regulator [Nocardioides panzhihuensis]TQL68880.1 DNA-binding response OmpR family regulator [Nocardioides albertanoniae]